MDPWRIILPDTSPLSPSPGIEPTIDAAGVVVFGASIPGVSFGLYTGSGAAPTLIVATAPSGGFIDFGIRPAIAAGRVAFEGVLPSGIRGIYTSRGGYLTTITDNSAIFYDFVEPAINALGGVAFIAGLVGGDVAIFAGSHPVADRVIGLG